MALTRRAFLRAASLSTAGLALAAWADEVRGQPRRPWRAAEDAPDLIYYNADILTMDAAQPHAEAIAIAGERILAVGSNADVRALARAGTVQRDLGGATVLPGLIDSHNHMLLTGLAALRVQLAAATSIAEIQAAVAEAAADTPPGEWIITANDWRMTWLREGRYPTRYELDAAAPDNPVYMPMGGHTAILNSRALALAGITRDLDDPAGGHIDRDADGEPLGPIFERPVLQLVQRLLPPVDPSDWRRALRTIVPRYHAVGLTSIHDTGLTVGEIEAYRDVYASGDLTMRSQVMFRPDITLPLDEMLASIEAFPLRMGDGDDWLRMAGLKVTVDGGMSLQTALLGQPYEGRPDFYGVQVTPTETVQAVARLGNRLGYQVGMHMSGDGAVDVGLDAYEAANAEQPILGKRWTVHHAHLPRPDQFPRMRALGLPIATQPGQTWNDPAEILDYLGPARTHYLRPYRTLAAQQIVLGGGSDSPVTPYPPLLGLWSAVAKLNGPSGRVHGPDERATVPEALYMYTLGAAYITSDEGRKGSLERGKLADLVVLADNPLAVPVDGLRDIDVLLTVVGGRTVYEAPLARRPGERAAALRPLAAGVDCCALGHHDVLL